MESDTTTKKHGAWLIPLAIFGIWAWPIATLGGLIWSRWLRPFTPAAKAGYWLLWASLTIGPFAIAYFAWTYLPFSPDRLWQVGVYLLSIAVWLLLKAKVIHTPSSSALKACLVALGGALFLGPAITFGGQVIVFLPLVAALVWNITGWFQGGAIPSLDLALLGLMLMPSLPVFVGLFIVQWPSKDIKGAKQTIVSQATDA